MGVLKLMKSIKVVSTVGLNDFQHIVEVSHGLSIAHLEAAMSHVVDLVVDFRSQATLGAVGQPGDIQGMSVLVNVTTEESHGHLDLGEVVEGWLGGLVLDKVLQVAIVPSLESLGLLDLTVVEDRLVAISVWEVGVFNRFSVHVVDAIVWLFRMEETIAESLTDYWADDLFSSLFGASWEHVVNVYRL